MAIVGATWIAVLALSLAAFLLAPGVRVRRVLFFPLAGSHRMVTEARTVPRHWDPERSARELVDAILLGPQRADAERLFPQGTTARALLLRHRTLYVDLSAEAAIAAPGAPLALADALDELVRTVRFNLRGVHEVVLSIDGQTPRLARAKKS